MRNYERERELEQRIYEMAEEYGRKKWLRIKRTFLGLSGGIYLLLIYHGLKSDKIDIDIEYLLIWLAASPIMAGFLILLSLGVLIFILDSTVKDRIELAKLEGKLIGMQSWDYERMDKEA